MVKRVAIILRGAVSRKAGRLIEPESVNGGAGYVRFEAAHVATMRHIVNCNPDCFFDFFVHCWNPDLEAVLRDLYRPAAAVFEDNLQYRNIFEDKINETIEYGGVSSLLSLKKSIELVERHHVLYDKIVIYRPDVLLWKDMILDAYDDRTLYVNAHPGSNGDFHFVMNSANMSRFKWCFDWISKTNPYSVHSSIRRFVVQKMGCDLVMDGIVPGRDQEVIRKIPEIPSENIDKSTLLSYGLSAEELHG